jgi:hypothetical protein
LISLTVQTPIHKANLVAMPKHILDDNADRFPNLAEGDAEPSGQLWIAEWNGVRFAPPK